jgi:hypothetical protein
MLIKYEVNPHLEVAMQFSDDPWLRFMHNVHTPAPYGQAWTFISIVPYIIGLGKFSLTWLSFKFFAFLGMFIAFLCLKKLINQKEKKEISLAILFLNPLILLETIANAHNDWWMMWPVLASFILISKIQKNQKNSIFYLLLIFILIIFSILTKFASILAIPFLIYALFKNKLEAISFLKNKYLTKLKIFLDIYFWDLISISFFLPLITARSQRFLTWYLIWPMTFLPLLKSKWWQNTLIIFSFSALFSYLPEIIYLPWLFFDRSQPKVLMYKQILLWTPAIIYNLFLLIKLIVNNVKNKR